MSETTPIITYAIIAITAIISFQGFNRYDIVEKLKHSPYREVKFREWYRLLTSGFVHSGWIHLLINMFVFYEFGRWIELFFLAEFGPQSGRLLYLAMYLLTIVAGDLPTLVKHKQNPGFGSIGASGAVSGVLFIFILINPWDLLWLYAIIPIPAIVAGIGYLIYSSWAGKRGKGRIDHMAHFYGAVFGVIFMLILKPSLIVHFFNELSNLPF